MIEASILICTKGRRVYLERLINTIKLVDYPRECLEIIIVEETNNPEPLPDVKYISIPEKNLGIGYARNIALNEATMPIVVFVDDDCEVERDWLIKLLSPFSDPEIIGVAGAVKVRNCNAIGWAENIIGIPGGGLRYIAQAKGCYVQTNCLSTLNCAYRKEILQLEGGFDSRAILGGEDNLLAKKVCGVIGKCLYVFNAVIYHKPRENLKHILQWFIRRGRAEIKIWQLDKTSNRGINIIFSSLTLKLFALTAIGIISGYPFVLIGIAFIVYILLNLWRTSWVIKLAAPLNGWLLVPFVKFVMDIGTDLGRLIELLQSLKELNR